MPKESKPSKSRNRQQPPTNRSRDAPPEPRSTPRRSESPGDDPLTRGQSVLAYLSSPRSTYTAFDAVYGKQRSVKRTAEKFHVDEFYVREVLGIPDRRGRPPNDMDEDELLEMRRSQGWAEDALALRQSVLAYLSSPRSTYSAFDAVYGKQRSVKRTAEKFHVDESYVREVLGTPDRRGRPPHVIDVDEAAAILEAQAAHGSTRPAAQAAGKSTTTYWRRLAKLTGRR